eukprot:comp8747_c0_seq1/m.9736 comp8747_c0_seq1/g.9736  ORF comp8747_c0_seq1/g.9736 comp8747_c0_seq1/m.9736 type:complete len:139 (-) comp8747_c0_seq1:31-447(-)
MIFDEQWLWAATFLLGASLMFIMVYFIISFSDMEQDYLNPIDFVKRLNKLILPEFVIHWFTTVFLLIHGHWITTLLNLPLAIYHAKKFMSQRFLLDSTTVITQAPIHKKECYYKLGFYLGTFFLYMFRMIYALIHHMD